MVHSAIVVDRHGVLNVATLDVTNQKVWQDPETFGSATLVPGSRAAVLEVSDTLFTTFAVDRKGLLNTFTLDLSNQKRWQGPETLGTPTLIPGSPVAVLEVSDTLFTTFAVDCNGTLNQFILDLINQAGWDGPNTLGAATLVPGSPVTVLEVRDTLFLAFAVDRNGLLNTFTLDLSNQKGWHGPDTLGAPTLIPGSPVAVLEASDTLFTTLAVDRNGLLSVFTLDLCNHITWHGPDTIGAPTLIPGSPVVVLKEKDALFTATTVDRNGSLNIFSLDLTSQRVWEGPNTLGTATLVPGSSVTVLKEMDAVFTAFAVDRRGTLNKFSLNLSNKKVWEGPDTLGTATLVPGSPVGALKASDTTFLALTVDRNGVLNVASLDSNNHVGWRGLDALGANRLVPGAPLALL
jgi:hypothetical protein